MKIMYCSADLADVISARKAMIGHDELDEMPSFIEPVRTLTELEDQLYLGGLFNKDDVLEFIYGYNNVKWDKVARELHYLKKQRS